MLYTIVNYLIIFLMLGNLFVLCVEYKNINELEKEIKNLKKELENINNNKKK